MTIVAIYARVSSARQKQDETIQSQIAAVRDYAQRQGYDVSDQCVFADDGHSGATLIRPALESLRDLIASVGVDVVLCHSPDRLARKFAYQVLLIEEFTQAGTQVQFLKGPRGDSPEDQLMVQFQGMFAEYEKAQILERSRRGKIHKARSGSVNVLGSAPFGYRYLRKTDHSGAGYEIVEHEAVVVAEMFRRYADDGVSIADLRAWLDDQRVLTRTGKAHWVQSVVWSMLRNPAYAGRAAFGKTTSLPESPKSNRTSRRQGRITPGATRTVARPRDEWIEIAVPAIVTEDVFERVARRLEENKRFARRNTKVLSLLQGLVVCSACGYAYRRMSTGSAARKRSYYRCLGADTCRSENGRVCTNRPVRTDHLDEVVWSHIAALLTDPQLIRSELDRRLEQARVADPIVSQRAQLDAALGKAAATLTRMIQAYQEQLISIDELRSRVPDLRSREAGIRAQIQALDVQVADRALYLKLADDLGGFLTELRNNTDAARVEDRQRVIRLVVRDVLVGPDSIVIRHRIPIRKQIKPSTTPDDPNTACGGSRNPGSQLRSGRGHQQVEPDRAPDVRAHHDELAGPAALQP